MTAPLIVQLVWTIEAGAPEEPTSPKMVESVQVTAPPPSGAALSSAKSGSPMEGAGAANAGNAPKASTATPSAVANGLRDFMNDFLDGFLSRLSDSYAPPAGAALCAGALR